MAVAKRVAIVTGAGSGIGRTVALGLAGDGFAVVLAGRRREQLEETVEAASDLPGDVLAVPTDVRDPTAVAELFDATRTTFDRLDLLFNNAGHLGVRVPLEDVSYDDWCATIDTNLTGAFLCTQAAFKMMRAQQPMGGRIINNGSVSAHAPRPDAAAYTASKHGMTGLTKQTALDGRRYDIACGQIDIGNAAEHPDPESLEGEMDVVHVSDAILYMANLPLDTNVLFLTVMASKMPLVGRG